MNPLTSGESSKHVSFDSRLEYIMYLPPDGGWGWVIVTVSFVMIFSSDGIVNTFGMFFDDIATSFDVEPTEVALTSSIMNGMYLITSPLSCGLINRYGFRIVAMSGGGFGAVAFFVSTYSTNMQSFVFIIGLLGGLGFNMIFTSSLIIVGFYFEKWRALTTSIAIIGGSVGSIVLPLVFNYILEKLIWTMKFKLISSLCFGIAVLSLLYKPLKPFKVVEIRRNGITESRIVSAVNAPKPEKKSFIFRMSKHTSNEAELGKIFVELQSSSVINVYSGADSAISLKEQTNTIDYTETSCEEFTTRKPKSNCCRFCSYSHNKNIYRDDVFYTGSIYVLPEYKEKSAQHDSQFSVSLSYHMHVSRAKAYYNIPLEKQTFCNRFQKSVVGIMKEMLHYKIMKSPSFLVLTLSGFFTMIGFYIPFIFITERGKEIGLSSHWSTLLLTILGISSTVGTIVCGTFSFFPQWNVFTFSYVTLFLAGGIMIIFSFIDTLVGQVILVVVYGFNITSFVALRTVVITYLVGLQSLTNAVGISFLFYGIANFLGIFLSAHLAKVTGTYKYCFLFGGLAILLSAILLVPVNKISKWEQERNA